MADRYNNINNTSPYVSALKNDKPPVPRSNLDYSRSHHGNMNIGTLEILDCFPTLPNSDYIISEDLLIKVRVAMKKRIMTGQRIYVHAWYMSLNSLWEAAQNHIDHGRSGLIDINKPYTDGYIYSNIGTEDEPDFQAVRDTFTPNSPANQIGIPARRQNSLAKIYSYCEAHSSQSNWNSPIQDFNVKSNALPEVMYQRIYLDKYAPKNLLQHNKNAYPDNIEKVRIPYDTEFIEFLPNTNGQTRNFSTISASNADPNGTAFLLTNDSTPVYINKKRYRQKKGDYFVCSSPFADLIRGDTPSIDLVGLDASIDFKDALNNYVTSVDFVDIKLDKLDKSLNATNGTSSFKDELLATLNKAKISGNVQTQVTAAMLQTLLALTLIKQRNALTNGDYNEMVRAQFGYSPNVDDYSAKYIGGFYQDIVFSDVTQTSTSTENSPLGNQSGQAMSANSGFIGKFHSDDWGYIMVIASIVPDEIYNQGIPRFLGELSADEEYYSPILNNLPPQPIKNKEIYLTNSESTNEDVLSYTQRYEHLRHRENYASGFVGLGSSIAAEDSSYVQHKRFTNSPQFNAKFVSLCPDNVDMSIYSVIDEPPYIFTCINNVDKVEPLPFDSMPSDLGLKYA